MSKGIIETIGGGLAVAGGAAFAILAPGIGTAVGKFLIMAGAGLVINGVGTMMAQASKIKGFATTERNPIAPWEVQVGEARVGGSIRFLDDQANSALGDGR